MRALTYNNHTSWRHIWRLAWPIIISNITVPLVGAVDVAMMGRIDDPAFIGGVGLGMMLFNAIYFGMGFLRMGTTGLVAQSQGEDAAAQIARIMVRGLVLACAIGMIIILATPVITKHCNICLFCQRVCRVADGGLCHHQTVCGTSSAWQYGGAGRIIWPSTNVWRHAVIADCQSDQSGTEFCVCFGPWHGGQRGGHRISCCPMERLSIHDLVY